MNGTQTLYPNDRANDFAELSQRAQDAGLLARRAAGYLPRAVILVVAFVGAFALLAGLGQSWWQLAVAVGFGVLFTQAAFLGHDAAHQQVFTSGRRNEWLARILANGIVGMSYGWWVRKHGKHHAHPNTIGRDGDIDPGVFTFVPQDAEVRTGLAGRFGRSQGWMFLPLLMFFGLVLHYQSVDAVARTSSIRHRRTEAVLLAVRLIGFPLLVLWLLGPGLGLAFLAVQLAVFGCYMGSCFAPNHKGMPLIPDGVRVDFVARQVLTSRNIRGGRLMHWAMGGLNYQVEHHIFPRMPSAHLRTMQPIVRDWCARRNIPYTETGLVESWAIILGYLNDVGRGEAGPMELRSPSENDLTAPDRVAAGR